MNRIYLRKPIKFLTAAAVMLLVSACNGSKTEGMQTIDSEINQFTDKMLTDLKEKNLADSGLIMVVNTHTGYIKAASEVGCANKNIMDNFRKSECSCAVKVATWLAALESGRITLSDTVDTYNGIYTVYGRALKDSPKNRHGKMNYHDAFVQQSNIATYLAASAAYKNNTDSLINGIRLTGLNVPKRNFKDRTEFVWASLGYGYKITPWEMIEYVNGIANGGTIVKLMSINGLVQVVEDRMADARNIQGIRQIFENKENLNKLNLPDGTQAGAICTVTAPPDSKSDAGYKVELYGYLPIDKPKYTVYICAYKQNADELYGAVGELYASMIKFLSAR